MRNSRRDPEATRVPSTAMASTADVWTIIPRADIVVYGVNDEVGGQNVQARNLLG